jgi:hypothetical protein
MYMFQYCGYRILTEILRTQEQRGQTTSYRYKSSYFVVDNGGISDGPAGRRQPCNDNTPSTTVKMIASKEEQCAGGANFGWDDA